MASTKIINIFKGDSFEEIFPLLKETSADEIIFVIPKRAKFLSRESHYETIANFAINNDKKISIMSPDDNVAELSNNFGFSVLRSKNGKKKVAKKVTPSIRLATPTVVPQDSSSHEDDTDAYDRDVIVPSDETLDIEHGEDEAEDEIEKGMHVEDGGKDEKNSHVEIDELNSEPREDDKDEEVTAGGSVDMLEPEAEFAVSDNLSSNNEYEAMGVKIERSLDGISSAPRSRKKMVSVKRKRESAKDVGVSSVAEERIKLPDLESVWYEQGETDKNVWSGIRKEKEKSHRPKRSYLHGFLSFRNSWKGWSDSGKKAHTGKKFVLIGVTVIVLAIFAAIIIPRKATVTIRPLAREIKDEIRVEISKDAQVPDLVFSKLPGNLVSVTRTAEKKYQSTGKEDVFQKARGKITIHNTYSASSQTLIATTRFESPSGLIFRTLTTVVVPGAKVSEGDVTPGTIVVNVIADKAGPNYNIEQTRFVIPAFRERGDTARFEKYWGTSDTAFRGGASGLADIVTESDYTIAKNELLEILEADLLAAAMESDSDTMLVSVSDAVVEHEESTTPPGQAASDFTISIDGSQEFFAYKNADIVELVSGYVNRNYGLDVVSEKLNIVVIPQKYNEAIGSLSVTVRLEGQVYSSIDREAFLRDLLGKKESEIQSQLEDLISRQILISARVTIAPPWFRSMPSTIDRILLTVEY